MKDIIEKAWPKVSPSNLLKLDLQFFADPDPNPTPPDPDPNPDPKPNPDPPAPGKTYTEEELQEIVKQRVAREKKAAEKAVKEAEKLAKMNEDQKKQYELEKLQKELEDYKKKDAFYSLSKEATKMLAEKDIVADDELLSFVVKESAEDTQTAVNTFISLVDKKVQEGVKKALSGKAPKVNTGQGAKNPFSEEHFNLTEQGRLLKENPELYKKLKSLAGK